MPGNKSHRRLFFFQPSTGFFKIRFRVLVLVPTTVQDVPHVPNGKPGKEIFQRWQLVFGLLCIWINRIINEMTGGYRRVLGHLIGGDRVHAIVLHEAIPKLINVETDDA